MLPCLVLCILHVNITNLFLDDQWDLCSLKLARDQDYTVFLKDKSQLLHEQTQTRKTKFYKHVIKVIKTNVLDKKHYSDLSMAVNKFTVCSVFRLVLIGKERLLAAMLAGCNFVWQSESGKAGIKNKERNSGKNWSRTLVGELCSAGRSSRGNWSGSTFLMNAQQATYHRTTESIRL